MNMKPIWTYTRKMRHYNTNTPPHKKKGWNTHAKPQRGTGKMERMDTGMLLQSTRTTNT